MDVVQMFDFIKDTSGHKKTQALVSTYTHSRAHCRRCSVTHAAVNERWGRWCGATHGTAGWNEAWEGSRPGSTAAPWHWHKLLAQSGRVWDLWELLWVRDRELRLSQKVNPWPGHGGGRQSFSEAISISLCPFHLVPGAQRHAQGAVSWMGSP